MTLHIMDQDFDTGDIILERYIINDNINYFNALFKLLSLAADCYVDIINNNRILYHTIQQKGDYNFFKRSKRKNFYSWVYRRKRC